MDEFVSYRAYEVMEKKMLKKDFIRERGYKKLISPFRKVIEKRSWNILCEHKSVIYVVRFLMAIKHTYPVKKFKNFAFSNSTRDPCDPIK